jgi:hypothetical protein
MRTLTAKTTPLVRVRRRLAFTVGVLSLIIAGSTFFATRPTRLETPTTQDPPGVPVKTATATQETLPLEITAVGTAKAYSSAAMDSDVDCG